MNKALMIPALAMLLAMSACNRPDTTNATNEVMTNDTMAEPTAPMGSNMSGDGSGMMDNGADNMTGGDMDNGMDGNTSGSMAGGNMANGM